MDERALLKRLKQKNEKALEETIQLYTAYITTIIREILNSKATVEDIEELVADTFISLWQSAGKINYMQYSSLKAYIGEIARNKAKDYLRKNKNINLELYENAILIDDGIDEYSVASEPLNPLQRAIHSE